MSWLSNIIRGKNPMTRGADQPIARPPANGPGTPGYTGPTNPFQYHPTGTTTTNNPAQTGVTMPDLGDIGQWVWDNKEGIFKFVAGAGAAYEGVKNAQLANQYMREGIDLAKEDYNSRAKYRDAAGQMLLDPRTPDLSGLFAGSGNPYAATKSIPTVGARAPQQDVPPGVTIGPDGNPVVKNPQYQGFAKYYPPPR
jgi:hypothetical protein